MANIITDTDFQNVALAISAYSDEAYTNAKKLNSTGIVGSDNNITANGESFIGQFRYYKPLTANINLASLSVATDGVYTDIETDIANYVKTVRTFGAQQVNLQEVISKQDGLAKIARDFAEVRAQDEHDAVLQVLKGVAHSEVARGDAGGSGNGGLIEFDTDADAENTGNFVDINAEGAFGAEATGTSDERKLFDATAMGAARGERLFRSIGMGFKDYEPDYMYLVTSPELMAEMRAANLVDDTIIVDGNLEFSTIFGGKFRLILTRANQMLSGASAGDLNAQSTKCTFVIKPGAVSSAPVGVPTPVEVDRNAASYTGGGSTNVWYRYGFIMHPNGYDWNGATNVFASNEKLGDATSYLRKFHALNLDILPIFHS
jgi:hypothetical protein